MPRITTLAAKSAIDNHPRKAVKITLPGDDGFIMYVHSTQVDLIVKMYPRAIVEFPQGE